MALTIVVAAMAWVTRAGAQDTPSPPSPEIVPWWLWGIAGTVMMLLLATSAAMWKMLRNSDEARTVSEIQGLRKQLEQTDVDIRELRKDLADTKGSLVKMEILERDLSELQRAKQNHAEKLTELGMRIDALE